MTKVFISYRREDAKWQAREIYRSLTQVLSRDHVFMDINSIPPGADFVDVLESWVDRCEILLALIGSGWVNAIDPKTGRRRLDNPNDFVRVEIRKALARGIPVVPVLLDGARMLEPDELPDDLKQLTRRNAQIVEHRTVDTDVERLIRELGLSPGVDPPAPQPQTDAGFSWLNDLQVLELAASTPSTELGRQLLEDWPSRYTGPLPAEVYRGVASALWRLYSQLVGRQQTTGSIVALVDRTMQAVQSSNSSVRTDMAFGGARIALSNARERAECGATPEEAIAAYESEAMFSARKFRLARDSASGLN